MKFKYIIAVLMAAFLSVTLAQAAAKAPKNQLPVKAGDTAYVCECGKTCGCEVAAMKPGKCGCGHDLAKVSVTKVKGAKAYYQGTDGKEHAFKLAGKYVCGCGSECCQMVSNKPGKCACGKDLVAAKK